jgi:hypothetical protein
LLLLRLNPLLAPLPGPPLRRTPGSLAVKLMLLALPLGFSLIITQTSLGRASQYVSLMVHIILVNVTIAA